MKVFVFIMAVLVLTLSVMPCADANAMNHNHAKTELTQASHHQHSPSSDDCSPFCHCTCCAGFAINHFLLSFTIVSATANQQTSSFLPSETIDITLPVWQPPQLI